MGFSILLLFKIIVTVIAQETVLYDAYFGTPLTARRENFLAGAVNASLYSNGTFMGSRSTPDDTFRAGILSINNTEADLTQGSYIQPAARFDHNIDPLGSRIFQYRRFRLNLTAVDFMRGRDSGFPPYNEYRKLCGLKPAIEWEDFGDAIDKDKIEELRRLYGDVNDVELMVAIYIEKWKPGAYMGPTLYCIMVKTLLLWRKSDKFFFEHGDFPAALTIRTYRNRAVKFQELISGNGGIFGVTNQHQRHHIIHSNFHKSY